MGLKWKKAYFIEIRLRLGLNWIDWARIDLKWDKLENIRYDKFRCFFAFLNSIVMFYSDVLFFFILKTVVSLIDLFGLIRFRSTRIRFFPNRTRKINRDQPWPDAANFINHLWTAVKFFNRGRNFSNFSTVKSRGKAAIWNEGIITLDVIETLFGAYHIIYIIILTF